MTEQKIAEIFEQVGLAKIVRELGNNELLNAVQSAMIEIAGSSEKPNNHFEQPVCEGLEEEIERVYAEDKFTTRTRASYSIIARHFAQWGAEHRGSSETPNDLEEAARKEYPCDKSWMTPDMLDLHAHKQVAFRKGAEWQKEQDTRDMYMSDNRHFEKVYQLGRTDMREQMMKEAICYVAQPDTPIGNVLVPFIRIGETALSRYGIKVGDKVRIIIVKEDKQLTSTPNSMTSLLVNVAENERFTSKLQKKKGVTH